MRWILVFIFLYLIPIVVLFKNYRSFKRACIYGGIYVVLSTTIVITNIYLSGIKVLENTLGYDEDIVLETYLDQYEIEYLVKEEKMIKCDLEKIDKFRKDIYSIEKIALIPMRECIPYTSNLQKNLESFTQIKNEVKYAKEKCEEVVKLYDNINVPPLSKDEYTQSLHRAKINVKKTYELRTLAMENSINLIETKNPIYINKIKEYLKLSDKEIDSFRKEIDTLKDIINKQ